MEKLLKIYLLFILLLFILSVCSNKETHNKNKCYSVLITMGNLLEHSYKYKLIGEVISLTKKENVIQNFSLKITNTSNNKFINYLLPTIKTPVFELKDIDNDGEKDIFMVYYTGGMHVFTYEQLVFSSKYEKLFLYNAEEIGINLFGKPTINYSSSKYPEIHDFFKTNIKNIKKYKNKFKEKLNPKLFKKLTTGQK